MKQLRFLSLLLVVTLLMCVPGPISAHTDGHPSGLLGMERQILSMDGWMTAPFPPDNFQYARHDGVFVPGPALAEWANKVYFLGGRTSPPTESPIIWRFDPVYETYTNTGETVVEDVSNYNGNLIMDDGTGRGPAIYVIGGTNKDGGGTSIGMVQRYYPMTNEAEALGAEDNFNGSLGGARVAAVGTAVVDDIIYVFGGWETSVAPYFVPQTWMFDPTAVPGSRWTMLSAVLAVPRSYIMSAVQDGKIYAFGGVGFYDGSELDPVDTVEVLDTANLAAGWTTLAPLPVAGGEGRGFGFDSDTKLAAPWDGKLYVVAANNWADVSGAFWQYDVISNTWTTDLPVLPTPRADLAASFVPLCTADPDDGMPAMWTFGGRVNTSCEPPLGPVEYYPLACDGGCVELSEVAIHGPETLMIGETGTFTPSIAPLDASAPVYLEWTGGITSTAASYTWDTPGTYSVALTATNCDGVEVTDTVEVVVYDPCIPLDGAVVSGPPEQLVNETGIYSVTLSPADASLPIELMWSNGITATVAAYTFPDPGWFTVTVSAENCGGVITGTLGVEVIVPVFKLFMPLTFGTAGD